jgi:hypothetical protein
MDNEKKAFLGPLVSLLFPLAGGMAGASIASRTLAPKIWNAARKKFRTLDAAPNPGFVTRQKKKALKWVGRRKNSTDIAGGLGFTAGAPVGTIGAIPFLTDEEMNQEQAMDKYSEHKLFGFLKAAMSAKQKLNAINEKEETRARWGAASGALGGGMVGGTLGAYPGILHPEAIETFVDHVGKSTKKGIGDAFSDLREDLGEGWKKTESVPEFGKDTPFGPAEREARAKAIAAAQRQKRVILRILKGSGIGALAGVSLGALAGYTDSKAGKDPATGMNKLSEHKLFGFLKAAMQAEMPPDATVKLTKQAFGDYDLKPEDIARIRMALQEEGVPAPYADPYGPTNANYNENILKARDKSLDQIPEVEGSLSAVSKGAIGAGIGGATGYGLGSILNAPNVLGSSVPYGFKKRLPGAMGTGGVILGALLSALPAYKQKVDQVKGLQKLNYPENMQTLINSIEKDKSLLSS